mmetsp:Transcript_97419/g.175961  ORF Transcript_97419/g.175961 Transcript_97419/m.175961 type:complete len:227 (+) Transcript_97419:133-813(+)
MVRSSESCSRFTSAALPWRACSRRVLSRLDVWSKWASCCLHFMTASSNELMLRLMAWASLRSSESRSSCSIRPSSRRSCASRARSAATSACFLSWTNRSWACCWIILSPPPVSGPAFPVELSSPDFCPKRPGPSSSAMPASSAFAPPVPSRPAPPAEPPSIAAKAVLFATDTCPDLPPFAPRPLAADRAATISSWCRRLPISPCSRATVFSCASPPLSMTFCTGRF